MLLGENIEEQDQIVFNSLQGNYEAYKKWKLSSFVEFWKYLSLSGQYIEKMGEKKDKKPELKPDFWESIK